MAKILPCTTPPCVTLGRASAGRLSRWVVLLLSILVQPRSTALAVTPESPEVRQLIEGGLRYLESNTDQRLGGRCLIALAFHKDGAAPTHPRIEQAVAACRQSAGSYARDLSVYDNGLAIIFLAEMDPQKYRNLISQYAGTMFSRQKPNGGWSYESYRTGDTSQTQYAALSYWELLQIGMAPKVESVEACLNWLLRTQDPSGVWGYQGTETTSSKLVKQNETSVSMFAAGLGSTMIFGNVLGLVAAEGSQTTLAATENVPSALRLAAPQQKKRLRTLSGNGVDPEQLQAAITRGQRWYDTNFNAGLVAGWHYPCYLLYSLERYKSFEELLTGDAPEEPNWYQVGYQYLKEEQQKHGGWHGNSGDECATAFAILFLLRSTQKSIKANLGEGTLVGGRGLSANLARMKLRGGRLVTEQPPTEVDRLLGMLEGDQSEDLESLIRNPAALRVSHIGPEEARRLQQIVRSGKPEARVVAVRALARLRNLDYVPTLLFAMTDPDHRVVREADAGLRFVSRRFGGFRLPDNFSETQRYNVLDRWKVWYRHVRPSAPPIP